MDFQLSSIIMCEPTPVPVGTGCTFINLNQTHTMKTRYRTFVTFVLLLGFTLLIPPVGTAQNNPDPARFSEEIQRFRDMDRKNTLPENPILFVGSSSIRMWPTAESFPHQVVLNRGFGGSHISDVIHFLDEVVLKYRPEMIVFYAGDNDVAAGKSPEQVLSDYRTFTESVREALQNVPIVYLSIKPSGRRWELWPVMERANALIEQYSEQLPNLYYLDLATIMLAADGKPDSTLFLPDQLHLNERGYQLWTQTLEPVLERVLATSPAE